jgi:hypothetical protein
MLEMAIIGTVGSTVIVASLVEKKMFKKGKHIEAETIQSIVNTILGGVTFGSFLFFAWKLVNMFILGV